ncbi:MAG: quinolinate synthase NadA [Candidatus Bathyarchaeota archaeon]|nr:MAG: quinolinate synthase NadA [Candidatus Bathyarchaeota archaeon]
MDRDDLVQEINRLRSEKKAVILAHNYQRPEIQDIADYLGDSVELAQRAMEEDEAEILVVAAVDFMAETAFLLNPSKKVLLPSANAHCPMIRMLNLADIERYRATYPGIPMVLYVNTFAEAKAKCDVCCTSANAVKIVEKLDSETVIFGPDCNLADYVQEQTNKTVIPIPDDGFCPTHLAFDVDNIRLLKKQYPDARVLIHPECTRDVRQIADFVGSTSQIVEYASTVQATTFIIGTEEGILYRLRTANPTKEFVLAHRRGICPNMKRNTLEAVYRSLRDEVYPVTVHEKIAAKARLALERMFELS